MKRIAFLFTMLALAIGLQAQTNFRTITFEQGIEAAKKEGKLLFVDFHTSWCGPCKRMAREVFPTKAVGEYMDSHFVCLAIDAEKGEGISLAKTYKVTAYPTMAIINVDKSLKGTIVGYREPTQLINELERNINPKKSAKALKQRYADGERSAELVSAYALLIKDESMESRDRDAYQRAKEKADSIVSSYFNSLNDKQRLSPDNQFIYRSYAHNVYGPAMQFLIHHLDKLPASFKAEADSIVRNNYKQAMARALCSPEVSKNQLDSLEKDLKQLKLNEGGKYDVALKMAHMYRESNISEYIDFAHRSFAKLPSDLRSYYAEVFSDLFKDCDTATKKRAAWIVRDGLSILPANTIYFAASQLRALEGSGYDDPVRE